MKNPFTKGMSIVEIVIASAIIAVCVTGIVGAIQIYLKIVYQNSRQSQAVLLLSEAAEALQFLKDESYSAQISNKTPGTNYYLLWNGSDYELKTTPVSLPFGIVRKINFEEVRRDSTDQIVSSGGTVDSQTKKAIIEITWPYKDEIKTLKSEVLLHNIYEKN